MTDWSVWVLQREEIVYSAIIMLLSALIRSTFPLLPGARNQENQPIV